MDIPPNSPGGLFAGKLLREARVDSTNDRLKALAEGGAPEGTALLAGEQTAGRGTRGRTFHSPGGGLYLSLLLRPRGEAARLFTLTGRMAAAVCRALRSLGIPARIKWLNDIQLGGKKLCGILTELSPLSPDGTAQWVVVGIGLNLTLSREELARAGLEGTATSLAAEGYPADREQVCAAILRETEAMYRTFPGEDRALLEEYRALCTTPGRTVRFGPEGRTGTALAIGEDYSLTVASEDGTCLSLHSGDVFPL